MIITISGKAGSGKSTIAKLLAKKLHFKHYSIGDLMRLMAIDKKMNIIELNKLAEKDSSIDLELDSKLKDIGRTEDNFVVDGRLTSFFVPHAKIRIFLDAREDIRGKRILKDERKLENNKDFHDTMSNIEKREQSEKMRYMKYYGVNYLDKRLYNLIIDTSDMSPQQIVEKIMEFSKSV